MRERLCSGITNRLWLTFIIKNLRLNNVMQHTMLPDVCEAASNVNNLVTIHEKGRPGFHQGVLSVLCKCYLLTWVPARPGAAIPDFGKWVK